MANNEQRQDWPEEECPFRYLVVTATGWDANQEAFRSAGRTFRTADGAFRYVDERTEDRPKQSYYVFELLWKAKREITEPKYQKIRRIN